ncbi:TetR/AcrR family transcriptional regulator [Phenylobacterium sp.]|uniref:TetR/AcrR family transcriptional regulator n=1 Tax=Phenylobacterium sp. TaxID=1871053 RepID=UPI002DE35AA8|nr:TetR/AcrR family transcriptional regulator [Phenylobacterium sp.]
MSERRRYHAGDLPGRLIREARELLDEGGLKHLNLRALAARAGITAGSLYHHYDSKAALLGVVAAGGFKELRLELMRADGEAGEGRRLRGWATVYFHFAVREPALFSLMFDEDIAGLPQVVEAREAVLDVLRRIVAEVAALAGRAPSATDDVTLAIWAASHGAASLAGSAAVRGELIEDVIAGLEALFRPGSLPPA